MITRMMAGSCSRRSPLALPIGLKVFPDTLSALAQAYKAINAPRGELGARTLTGISTQALKANDATYALLEGQINSITAQRNQMAGKMIQMLENAAFIDQPIDEAAAGQLIDEATTCSIRSPDSRTRSAQGGPKAARYPSSGAGRQGGCEQFFRADKFRCNSTYQRN